MYELEIHANENQLLGVVVGILLLTVWSLTEVLLCTEKLMAPRYYLHYIYK